MLRDIQGSLQDINAIITGSTSVKTLPSFPYSKATELEKLIYDAYNQNPGLTKFILPGSTQIDAYK
jgi:cob(I)alamin adenosyltransferase